MNPNIDDRNFDGTIEDIVHAAREFGYRMRDLGREFARDGGFDPCFEPWRDGARGHRGFRNRFYFYPPANIYEGEDGSLVFEFALSGIPESDVSAEFKGDYLILTAKRAPKEAEGDSEDFIRRGFRPRDVDRQRYYVPAADYAQDQAAASYRDGMLRIVVPSKDEGREAVKVKIVKEGA